MRLRAAPPVDLTYCLNVHPGESWQDELAAIRSAALEVKRRVAPREPFGLGLRLGARAARELARGEELARFKDLLAENGLYVFTINGFPYGSFHGTRVKDDVYAPDWRTAERREYTIELIDILSRLLPEGVNGSISTVPCSYKAWVRGEGDVAAMALNLAACAARCAQERERSGSAISVALEPEPDCFLETTGEAIAFLSRAAAGDEAIRSHLGVCLDACHLAVEFEDLVESARRLRSAGVCLSKVHLSAAVRASATPESIAALEALRDPVYLHQVKVREPDGTIRSWRDVPDFLAERERVAPGSECRVHFHVPLYFAGSGPLGSTASLMTPEFFAEIARGDVHLEIETYTFAVLPPALRQLDLTESIAREFSWVLERVRV